MFISGMKLPKLINEIVSLFRFNKCSVGQKRIDASVLEGKEFIAINFLPSKTLLICHW